MTRESELERAKAKKKRLLLAEKRKSLESSTYIDYDGTRKSIQGVSANPNSIHYSSSSSVIDMGGVAYTTTSAYTKPMPSAPKFRLVEKRSTLCDYNCVVCNKSTSVGDVVFDQSLDVGHLTHHIVTCKSCMDKLFDKAPVPNSEKEFNRLRKQIMETGKAFPDAED